MGRSTGVSSLTHEKGRSQSRWLARSTRVHVLDVDRGLELAVAPERRDRARAAGVARVVQLRRGTTLETAVGRDARGGFGLLILAGLAIRELAVDGQVAGDLVGAGDLVPTVRSDGLSWLCDGVECRALAPMRVAVLHRRWALRMAPHPEIASALAGRAVAQDARLATLMAITHQPKLDARLWLLLWHLADRFGRVRCDGVHLELPITHEDLSHLARARRPSVSNTLGELGRRALLRREGDDWVLTGASDALDTERRHGSRRSDGLTQDPAAGRTRFAPPHSTHTRPARGRAGRRS